MLTRDQIVAAVTPEAVAAHYQIAGQWRGRWMRSRRCPTQDHSSDAMGISRDGMWHCWACDQGGDLIKLVAVAEGLDPRSDFPRILEIIASICGIVADDDFGGGPPAPRVRPAPPPLVPIADRLAVARKRAPWVWERLCPLDRVGLMYTKDRGLEALGSGLGIGHEIKSTPLRIGAAQLQGKEDLQRLHRMLAPMAIAVPVRSVEDGSMVDIRVRRIEPREGMPKIIGMLGGVVREGRTLYGCFGHPQSILRDLVIVVEGIFDYLTALLLWPHADVLGATDAGSYPLVALHAARALKTTGGGTVVLVAQRDHMSTDDEWRALPAKQPNGKPTNHGGADSAVNEATKNVIATLGARSCAWVECGPTHKDLNDKFCAGAAIETLVMPPPQAVADDDFG